YQSAASPTVTGISPTSGPTTGGTSVTITGTNLSGATAVHFGSTAATGVTLTSSTSITATAPAETSGVITPVQNSSTETASGTTEKVTLVSNVTAGDGLVLLFSNADDTNTVSSVSGGGVTWTRVDQENDDAAGTADTEIWYGLGSTGGAGTTTITVTLSGTVAKAYPINVSEWSGIGGVDQAPAGTFNHTGSAVADGPSITPTKSDDMFVAAVGANSTVTGAPGGGFSALTAAGASASAFGYLIATDSSSHQYTQGLTSSATWSGIGAAFSPAVATSGTVDVTVTTPGGTSATSTADQFSYQSAASPTVTGISPTSGPTTGGTSVTITGTNLSGATAVHFGSTAATGVTLTSPTSITAPSPAGASGTVAVTVTTPGGTSATSTADQFSYQSAASPTVTGISPTS